MGIRNFFNKLEEYLLVGGLMFIVALVFAQVIMRYIFYFSPAWVQELCTYVFIWEAWVGTSFAVKQGSHLKILFVLERFHGAVRRVLEMASVLIWFSFCLFLVWTGTKLVIFLLSHGELSIAMRIPMGYAYAAIPAGATLMGIRLVAEIIRVVKTQREVGE
ncbi:MAG: TRAP transporter small permease [Synergistetes bacterium]|nr:TRAP transporter small permease [Synergistota bacterium]